MTFYDQARTWLVPPVRVPRAGPAGCGCRGEPMAWRPLRFGRKLTVPSTVEIKHQLLTLWLKDQVAKETAEAAANDVGPAAASRRRDAIG